MLKLLMRLGRNDDFVLLLDKLLNLNRVLHDHDAEKSEEVHLPSRQRELDRFRA